MAKNVGKLASRYAKALLAAVEREQGTSASSASAQTPAQAMAQALLGFSQIWQSDAHLASAMSNPMFEREERSKALQEVAKKVGLSETAQRFLVVCFERDRISAFPEIAAAFAQAADAAAGLIHVEVVTARSIMPEEAQTIERGLSSKLSGRVKFQWRVDASLIGGMVVRYGGKVLDGSLSGRLQRIERRLMN